MAITLRRCPGCGQDAPFEAEITLVKEGDDAFGYSNEPYVIFQCEECGHRDTKRGQDL